MKAVVYLQYNLRSMRRDMLRWVTGSFGSSLWPRRSLQQLFHHGMCSQAVDQEAHGGDNSVKWQQQLLDAALPHVGLYGWSNGALEAAARDLGLSPAGESPAGGALHAAVQPAGSRPAAGAKVNCLVPCLVSRPGPAPVRSAAGCVCLVAAGAGMCGARPPRPPRPASAVRLGG
ncbi:hypothetical protein HaLaN_03403 [Haematococcus lacustris]|uniref:Uncharacterized protein n=1 Tax=Haematococcus lacustris TaxID=44745 RepID=A0A699YG54_HAELA|nr:hypothetical protein HaLaN_03403 [Haematococcus lacustris]